MSAIFLSASVPIPGRGNFYRTSDPFLIQSAVRELLIVSLGRRLIVWGGHPSITPMVWAACEDLDVSYAQSVRLYQSKYFEDSYPEENEQFNNVTYVDPVSGDRAASLRFMRETMFDQSNFAAAVFIGGMEGILDEYELFAKRYPDARVLAVPDPGGAARDLALKIGTWHHGDPEDLNFARLFYQNLDISPLERRVANMAAAQVNYLQER